MNEVATADPTAAADEAPKVVEGAARRDHSLRCDSELAYPKYGDAALDAK